MIDDNELEEMSMAELEKDRGVALRAVMSFIAVLIILGAAAIGVWSLHLSKPSAAKKEEGALAARVVEVALVQKAQGRAVILAEGVVESQRVVNLTAEATGMLIEVNPKLVAGGKVRKEEVLVEIDPSDYRTALEQSKAAQERARLGVADAELAIELEEAQREQALRDWAKLGRGEPSNLLARKPQLASARARLTSAQADVACTQAEVDRAHRNLARTIIRAPFDAVVRSEAVEVGAVLAPGTMLATLFSAGDLEVELSLKLADYALLQRDEDGAVVGEVSLRGNLGVREVAWRGRVVRTTGEVDRGALSAGIVVAIEPSEGESEWSLPPPGLFVRAELLGQSIADAVVVPRGAIREGDRVAIVNEQGLLDFRQLTVVRSNATEVFVSDGVSEGERVVLTRITGALSGMAVEVEEPIKGEEGE